MVSDGTLNTIVLGVQYLQRDDIYMRIAGVETPQSGGSGYTWYFIDNTTLHVNPTVPNGVEVVIYRRTDVDAMYNVYSQNAQFDEATIDENNQQLLYIAQEYLEQGIPGAGIDTIEFVRDDGVNTYYRLKRTDGSYSDEFSVPSVGSTVNNIAWEALRRSYTDSGYNVVGTFENGFTYTTSRDVGIHYATGKGYTGPAGVVPPGTNPTIGGYTDVSASTVATAIAKLESRIYIYKPAGAGVDDTPFINAILSQYTGIYFTEGVYNIDPDVGIRVRAGSVIDGAGFMKVVLLAKQVGATVAELAAYTKGSLIKRAFTPGVANSYVSGVHIDNVSIIMRHPTTTDPNNYRQIGVDLRNCDRSLVGPGLYAGNTTLPGMPYTWEPPRASQAQGYGIVYGTRNSNDVDYCGGVGGVAESPKVYGARKNIVVDDPQLSPYSAAHATIVRSPDLQIGVELISCPSQYNAGTVFEDCLLQSLQRFEPTDTTVGLLLAGYNCRGTIRYLEGGPNCDIVAALTSSSKDCALDVLYASVTGASAAAITDNGSTNSTRYREITAVSGGKTTKGRWVETFDKGYVVRKVVSTYVDVVGAQTVTGDSGVTVTRTGAGAYTITLDKAFSGAFGVNISAKTNPSRQGFSFAYSSMSNNTIHIDTFVNNSVLDPEQMTIEIFQV